MALSGLDEFETAHPSEDADLPGRSDLGVGSRCDAAGQADFPPLEA